MRRLASCCFFLALGCSSLALVVQRVERRASGSNVTALGTEIEKIKAWNAAKSSRTVCKNGVQKSVAMIISGRESRLLLSSKLKNVVEPLAESGVSVDIYIDVLSISQGFGTQFTPVPSQAESDDLAAMQEELPKFLNSHCGSLQLVNIRREQETVNIPPRAVPRRWANRGQYQLETIKNVFRRYSSYKFILEKVAVHEKQRERRYDFVLVTRDDDDWLGQLQFAELSETVAAGNAMFSKNCLQWKGFNDMTLLFGRQAADKVLGGMLSFMMDSKIVHPEINAETALARFITDTDVKVHQVPFRSMPTTCAVYQPSGSEQGLSLCHKKKVTCEKEGWNLNFCKKVEVDDAPSAEVDDASSVGVDDAPSDVDREDLQDAIRTAMANAALPDAAMPKTNYQSSTGPATAEMWVINLDERPERWSCAQKQLAESPYPLHRFPAVLVAGIADACPHLRGTEGQHGPFEVPRAILCANYLLWEKAYNNSSAEFIIVLEDDIAFHKGKDQWGVVSNLLNGPCAQGWDYISVDMWKPKHHKWVPEATSAKPQCVDASPGHNLYGSPQDSGKQSAGAHMQILRRESIPALLDVLRSKPRLPRRHAPKLFAQTYGELPYANMDMIPWHVYDTVTARTFQPEICSQAFLVRDPAVSCDSSVARTDDYQKRKKTKPVMKASE